MRTMYGGMVAGDMATQNQRERSWQLENERARSQQAVDLGNMNAQLALDNSQMARNQMAFGQSMATENMRRQGAAEGRTAVAFGQAQQDRAGDDNQRRLAQFVTGAYGGARIDDLRSYLGPKTGKAANYTVGQDGSITLVGQDNAVIKTIPGNVAQMAFNAATGRKPVSAGDQSKEYGLLVAQYEQGATMIADADKLEEKARKGWNDKAGIREAEGIRQQGKALQAQAINGMNRFNGLGGGGMFPSSPGAAAPQGALPPAVAMPSMPGSPMPVGQAPAGQAGVAPGAVQIQPGGMQATQEQNVPARFSRAKEMFLQGAYAGKGLGELRRFLPGAGIREQVASMQVRDDGAVDLWSPDGRVIATVSPDQGAAAPGTPNQASPQQAFPTDVDSFIREAFADIDAREVEMRGERGRDESAGAQKVAEKNQDAPLGYLPIGMPPQDMHPVDKAINIAGAIPAGLWNGAAWAINNAPGAVRFGKRMFYDPVTDFAGGRIRGIPTGDYKKEREAKEDRDSKAAMARIIVAQEKVDRINAAGGKAVLDPRTYEVIVVKKPRLDI